MSLPERGPSLGTKNRKKKQLYQGCGAGSRSRKLGRFGLRYLIEARAEALFGDFFSGAGAEIFFPLGTEAGRRCRKNQPAPHPCIIYLIFIE